MVARDCRLLLPGRGGRTVDAEAEAEAEAEADVF